jgi:hypothetical protein
LEVVKGHSSPLEVAATTQRLKDINQGPVKSSFYHQ